MLKPLADALGVTVGWLCGDDMADVDSEFERRYLETLLAVVKGGESLDAIAKRFATPKELLEYLAAPIPPKPDRT